MEATVYISLIGTALGMCSRVPQLLRVYERQSGGDISARALLMNICANLCFLSYSASHEQWPIAINNVVVVSLDSALLHARFKFGEMKKSSSGTDLSLMVPDDD